MQANNAALASTPALSLVDALLAQPQRTPLSLGQKLALKLEFELRRMAAAGKAVRA